jgi:hypothetical protein
VVLNNLICVSRIPKGREIDRDKRNRKNRVEEVFEEIIVENFLKIMKRQ